MIAFKEGFDGFVLEQSWNGSACALRLTNRSGQSAVLHEVELYRGKMEYAPDTPCRGEGYNKLAQYAGTVSDCRMSGSLGDYGHYRLPKPEGCAQVYNYLMFMPTDAPCLLLGFSSCNRFSGMFRFDREELSIVMNCEGIELEDGETVELEEFFCACGGKDFLLKEYGQRIQVHHPRLPVEEIPTGWCSWLVYGPDVTEADIYENMTEIRKKGLKLKYIQIDDGYQQYMGDWLYPTDKFPSGIEKLCADIRAEGFEPGIWVAPFIAEKDSLLFREHPDWFVMDEKGEPLSSDRVTFGGWSHGPWYMLDGTNPQACAYLKNVFHVMRSQWNIRYFKLDANMWGALPFGRRFERNRTSIEAYRMGMEAVREGAGEDCFLLGCNAPMWPSLGLVHGMRITNDNNRDYSVFRRMARECFPRNWQNGMLWVNDPDTVVLENANQIVAGPDRKEISSSTNLSREEFLLQAAYALASGGMMLSGDRVRALTEESVKILEKLLPPSGKAARFDEAYEVGWTEMDGSERLLFLFNYGDKWKEYDIGLAAGEQVFDFWSGDSVAVAKGRLKADLAPHSAGVYACRKL